MESHKLAGRQKGHVLADWIAKETLIATIT
jgi:hypothetical protein